MASNQFDQYTQAINNLRDALTRKEVLYAAIEGAHEALHFLELERAAVDIALQKAREDMAKAKEIENERSYLMGRE